MNATQRPKSFPDGLAKSLRERPEILVPMQAIRECMAMPEGYDLKKILTRQMRRVGVKVSNRIMATRLLTHKGRVVGALGLQTRTGAFVIIRAKAVILCCGAAGRLGLPRPAISTGPTRTRPTRATATRWRITPAPS